VEFYESVGDPKYSYYQDKTIKLLQKEDRLLRSSMPTAPKRSKSTTLTQHRKADSAIKSHHQTAQRDSKKLQLNLASQNENISKRLQKRRQRMASCSPNRNLKVSKDADVCAGVGSDHNLDRIIDEFVLKKLETRRSIKTKYETELNNLKEFYESSMFESIKKELLRKMELEITEAENKIETQKKQAIQQLTKSVNKE